MTAPASAFLSSSNVAGSACKDGWLEIFFAVSVKTNFEPYSPTGKLASLITHAGRLAKYSLADRRK